MLRDIYAPTDLASHNVDPSLSAAEKLTVINSSPVEVRPWKIGRKIHHECASFTLPFVEGSDIFIGTALYPRMAFSKNVDVGDAELYGNGIGSRLLRATLRYAVEQDADVTEFHTGWARLGLVNTVVKVLSEENVWIHKSGNDYGRGSDQPLEAVFDDFPPTPDEPYLVNSIGSLIDRDLAMTWEQPVAGPPQM